ncbi:hypothetical protein QF026_000611 [Streptomyces aurantiacus]|uniref:transglycosylase SLT domain-containing protein n=1 Tax=Streptomyces aurantiacus TaxID=47760 RepID=UPI0027920FDC|nr:transglycosylase SLT domain-containing protein [Streptomyces aurantiacus]MDQ0772145.1 hypothetical protein [Streptomyces aurantiacus]
MGASGGDDAQSSGSSTTYIAGGIATGVVGCFVSLALLLILLAGTFVTAALGWIFWPIVLLCKIGILDCGSDGGGGSKVDTTQVIEAYNSDGRGALNENAVPAEYLERIKSAGKECSQIGPIVIVSQIQLASQFNEKLVGTDGREGISQMPPDKFKEFGKDDDSSGETSALNAADSIMAQGRYMCSLAKEIDTLIANKEVEGDALNMTLAAYKVGLDAVKQAKGVPKPEVSQDAQSYIVGVRSSFALYSADASLTDETYPSLSARPTPTSS